MLTPTQPEIDRVLAMIGNLAWKAFTPRDERVAEWIVGWNDSDEGTRPARAVAGRKEEQDE
jgi:hypothetical protein